MLLNSEYMKRELAGKKLLVDDEFMAEVNMLFMERLSVDEELGKIIRENNVDLEKVLSTSIDRSYYRTGGSFTVMKDLTQYFLKSDTLSVSGIVVTVNNHSLANGINATCRVNFATRLVFPKEFGLDGGIKFDYVNKFGVLSKNEITEVNNHDRKLKASFKVFTSADVVDVLFGVMHNLLKDGE
jgi:hypothetical protein